MELPWMTTTRIKQPHGSSSWTGFFLLAISRKIRMVVAGLLCLSLSLVLVGSKPSYQEKKRLLMSKDVVEQKLKKLGYSDAAVAAMLGNISVETGDTFNYKTKQEGGPGYGLLQLDFMKPHLWEESKHHWSRECC
jgi:hypothetical protein